mgnify:CR=1 FL=1
MKTEEELIWESYTQSKIIKESLDADTIGEIGFYFQDGASVDEIAEEFDIDRSQVKEAIKIYQAKREQEAESSRRDVRGLTGIDI